MLSHCVFGHCQFFLLFVAWCSFAWCFCLLYVPCCVLLVARYRIAPPHSHVLLYLFVMVLFLFAHVLLQSNGRKLQIHQTTNKHINNKQTTNKQTNNNKQQTHKQQQTTNNNAIVGFVVVIVFLFMWCFCCSCCLRVFCYSCCLDSSSSSLSLARLIHVKFCHVLVLSYSSIETTAAGQLPSDAHLQAPHNHGGLSAGGTCKQQHQQRQCQQKNKQQVRYNSSSGCTSNN